MAQCLLPAAGSLLHGRGSSTAHPVSLRPPTGEPDAGNPPVRFGGRGRLITSPYPYTALTPASQAADVREARYPDLRHGRGTEWPACRSSLPPQRRTPAPALRPML